ncbi:MAG: hypothetical protein ACM3RP_09905 [Chitinophagales bacterium]
MLSKTAAYAQTLRALDEWEPYLIAQSGLPGPRANLELAQAVAEEDGAPLLLAALWRLDSAWTERLAGPTRREWRFGVPRIPCGDNVT